ncbi:unnamed protein product [Mesocestoides corti]|uniref:STAS domain-containing protein n=1 Tax=Mesocestoides corti TaxID=53468 RepID=A0A0R3UM66_MESCO|nr:unnamed protein product [Mesocestoides corti]
MAVDVTVFIVALRPRLRSTFHSAGVYALLPEENFFMSLHDAVLVALADLQAEQRASHNADGAATPDVCLRRRKLTTDEVRSIMEHDPDVINDLSVVGEERAMLF